MIDAFRNNYHVLSLPEYAIPVASILVPIGTLFIVRTLDKGDKKKNKLELEVNEIHSFVETNRTLIARLVENYDKLDERLRRTENDLNRILGRLNHNKYD